MIIGGVAVYPQLFKLGPVSVNSYGLMIAVGFILAVVMARYRAKKRELNADSIYSLGILCIVGGFLGAKLVFIIIEFNNIYKNPSILLNLSDGFVVFGGIIGGVITGYIYCRIKKLGFLKYFDLAAPSIALAQGFGRIGCFLAGCCYGRETDWSLGVVFTDTPFAPHGVRLIPTQIFSSIGDFLITAILLIYAKRKRDSGKVAGLYLILYSVGRFIIEIFRNDPRGHIGDLSTSQLISIFTLLLGFALYNFGKVRMRFFNKQKNC